MHSGCYDKFLLFDGFDALSNYLQSQCAADTYNCTDDSRVDCQADIQYKALIDLDLINRKATQGCQARISNAEVIQRKRHAAETKLFDGPQHGHVCIE